jgi:outer membrane protein TolC
LLREVTAAHLALTDDLLGSVRVRYETGKTGQHAVLRLEVLSARLSDDLGDFDRQDQILVASLGRILARDDAGTFDTPTEVAPRALGDSDPDNWLAEALAERPSLGAIDARIAAEQAGATFAKVDGRPDPSVWIGYRMRFVDTPTDPGTDFASAGVGVPIPLGSGRASRGERNARFAAASRLTSERSYTEDRIRAEATIVHSRWDRAYTQAMTYADTLLPGARATLDTTRTEFALGRADFASLYQAEVELLQLERTLISATIETHLQAVDASALIGRDL